MRIWTTREFTRGFGTQDAFGITFSSEYDEESDWVHNLRIESQFFDPVVLAVVNRTSYEVTSENQPRLVSDYFS